MTVTSCKNTITIAAKEEILLTSGGGYIRIKGGNIEVHCPGKVSVKGATHLIAGPDSMNVPMPAFPVSNLPDKKSNRLDVYDLFRPQEFRNVNYQAKFPDGRIVKGALDEHGRSDQIGNLESGKLEFLVGESQREWDLVVDYDDL